MFQKTEKIDLSDIDKSIFVQLFSCSFSVKAAAGMGLE